MKTWIMAVCAGALLLAPMIRSQVNSAGGPVPTKVGTISMQAVVINSAEGKQSASALEAQFAPRSAELQNLQRQIEDLQKKVQSGMLSDTERAKLQADGERLTRTFQRKQQYFQNDVNTAQQELGSTIGRKMLEIINKYAKDNGYAVILDTSSQTTPVVYTASSVELTQEITRLYDQAHPAKAAATPASQPPAR